MQRDLNVELNHPKGNLFEEEKAADNLGLGNTATGWFRNFIVRNLSYTAVKPLKTDRLYARKA